MKVMKKTMWKTVEKTKAAVIVLIMPVLLAGCGKALGPEDLQEYVSPDETYSIEADKKYTVDDPADIGVDNWLILESTEEIEDTLAVMQLSKTNGDWIDWSNLEDVISYIEEAYELTDADKKEITKPENEQLSNIQAYSYEGTEDGYKYYISTVYAETDYAYYIFMNEEALVKRHSKDYLQDVCASFKENAEAIEAKTSFDTDVTDTIRWFNASNAILIAVNEWDYQLYGGLAADEMSQEVAKQILEQSWGVTDKDSADEIVNWLITEGHRLDFERDMVDLMNEGMDEIAPEDRAAFMLENFDVSEEGAEFYADWYNKWDEYEGEHKGNVVWGWDLNRALSQTANSYLAGYYTLEEALDLSLDIASMIQGTYDSWDEYMESYFTGYEYWAEESSDERRELYEDLKNAADNPFSVDFNTKLEKSW